MRLLLVIISISFLQSGYSQQRIVNSFNSGWKFHLGNDSLAFQENYNDAGWRTLNLPHDWSIEGEFSKDAPCKTDGGALPTGIGWYRKTFNLSDKLKNKLIYIDFDGVYRNSEMWINGHYLGKRAYGYSSFRYNLTPWIRFGKSKNIIAVKIDNSLQPNSRWYTGSGIYRNVWITSTEKVHIGHWGTFVTTPTISSNKAEVDLIIELENRSLNSIKANIATIIYDEKEKEITRRYTVYYAGLDTLSNIEQEFIIPNPELWSIDRPYQYKAVTTVFVENKKVDIYITRFGIRHFTFDANKGFILNGNRTKIKGVCMHHDLGALGAAFNKRAMERQLQILKEMGCNAIRTAHNPPAPEFLDLCDRMGFLVQDEAFDIWKKKKNKFDYNVDWNQWHVSDIQDMVLRDRNHPSIIMWNIGNEIREQFDSTGISISKELTAIVKKLDNTRPVTSALTENRPEKNFIWQSGALDVLGFNYKHEDYPELPKRFPNQKFIATELGCAEATRGVYDQPSDSNRFWPRNSKETFDYGNPDYTVTAYDNVCAYWGSTHEDALKAVKKYDFIAGMFAWSGFDYLGEPAPYPWPARSSYYGIIDLAGFPKDVYYLYQSEWTTKPVLHILPHWNWKQGDTVSVWVYYNQADEVELFVNDISQGIQKKEGDNMHISWKVPFHPGILKAVSRKNGQTVLTTEIHTAGKPSKIELIADRSTIKADGTDQSFITVNITDDKGNLVPDADNLVTFEISGPGFITGVDNGYQASLEPFKANYRKVWKGKCLVIVQSKGDKGEIKLKATSENLESSIILIHSKN